MFFRPKNQILQNVDILALFESNFYSELRKIRVFPNLPFLYTNSAFFHIESCVVNFEKT